MRPSTIAPALGLAAAAAPQAQVARAAAANSPKPPAGRNADGWVIETGLADLFPTDFTNALRAQQEVPGLRIVQVPEGAQVFGVREHPPRIAKGQLPGTVRSVTTGAVNAEVILDIGDGSEPAAIITNASVAHLGLAVAA